MTHQRAVDLHITSESDPSLSTIIDANFPFPVPVEIHIRDEHFNIVTSGNDSDLVINVIVVGQACLTGSTVNATRG